MITKGCHFFANKGFAPLQLSIRLTNLKKLFLYDVICCVVQEEVEENKNEHDVIGYKLEKLVCLFTFGVSFLLI